MSSERSLALPAALRRQYYDAGHWRAQTLWDSFTAVMAANAGTVAFLEGDRRLTFEQVRGDAERFGRACLAVGLRPGDAVAVHGRHCLESTVAIAGCAYAGLVPALLPHMFAVEQIRAILANCGARLLVSLGEDSEITRALHAGQGAGLVRTVVPDACLQNGAHVTRWSRFVECGDDSAAGPCPRAADDLALLIFSSGTTGEPKGVMHSANTLRFAAEAYARYQGIGPADTNLVVTAFGFVGSSVLGTYLTYLCGCTTVLQRNWNAAEALALIARHRVTHLLLMPTHAIDILESPQLDATDCSSLARGVVAGISETHRLDARRRLCRRPYPMYGMSESPAHVTGSTADDIDDLLTTEGRALPGTDLEIRDEEDRPLPVGVPGNILVRGPNRFLGYYRNESMNSASLTEDGYFRTGDVGVLDAKGMLTFVSRSKDIIRRGGVTITPADIEAALRSHPRLSDVAVVALPDPRLGERACACVITRDGRDVGLEELTQFLEARAFPRYQWPEAAERFDAFPRTPSLKVQKPELRRQVLERRRSR
ncbi:MAG TPA: class I adenylate-forming enzyme family protein [Steroidobacteraceae bacterium]|nr:class I adenylate-forming enzyme family protein [Steroidobacteraceae bacterium]